VNKDMHFRRLSLKSEVCRNKKLAGTKLKTTFDEFVGGRELLDIVIVI